MQSKTHPRNCWGKRQSKSGEKPKRTGKGRRRKERAVPFMPAFLSASFSLSILSLSVVQPAKWMSLRTKIPTFRQITRSRLRYGASPLPDDDVAADGFTSDGTPLDDVSRLELLAFVVG